MGWYSNDLRCNPEHFNLTTIGEIEWSEPCYSFDTTIVWQHEDGTFYWASDSGCSCPSPFEDFTSLDRANRGTVHDCIAALNAMLGERDPYPQYSWEHERFDYASPQVAEMVGRLMQINMGKRAA